MIGTIMKMNKFKMTGLIMLMSLSGHINAQVMTDLVHLELEGVNTSSKTVVIAGKPYKYKLNVKYSSYRFEEDVKKSVPLDELKVGEKYYFQVMAKGDDVKNKNFNNIVFIAKSRPSE